MTSTSEASPTDAHFQFPGGADRTVIIGATGTGKTIGGAWVLANQNFKVRPWVAFDYKREEFWDMVGAPPMRRLRVGEMPGKRGLHLMTVNPGQEDEVEDWLWKIWKRGNVGLFCDEVTLLPQQSAFKAIMRQGRSLRIPVISCSQRPVDVDREIFTESPYKMVFRLSDVRDYKTIQGFTRGAQIDRPLPPHWSYWYDEKQDALFKLRPVPKPAILAARLKEVLPTTWGFGG